jgi:hypothetical protein
VFLGILFTSPLSLLVRLTLTDRAVIMAPFLLVGFLLASKRVKSVPLELQLFYRFVIRRNPRVADMKGEKSLKEHGPVREAGQEGSERKKDEDLLVEVQGSWNSVPLSFLGKVKSQMQRQVHLYLRGSTRIEDHVSATKAPLRVIYFGPEGDAGTHLVAKAEGERNSVITAARVDAKKNEQLLETETDGDGEGVR